MREPSKIQQQAIMHLHGPAEIIAGPGSGKTFTIIHRILYLIKQCHISPEKILVITYTKAAAREMKERYEREIKNLSFPINNPVNFGTFHSICYHILLKAGVITPSSLIKEADRRRFIQTLLQNQGIASANDFDTVSNILNEISRKKNFVKSEAPDQIEIANVNFQTIIRKYDNYLSEQGLIDFDDMITECLRLLRNKSSVRKRYQEQFSYLLADEFQDINLPQYEILKLLAYPENNLFVVGDDDQAIYGFRGATPGIMKQFPADFQGCKRIMLTENYRSGSKIINLAGEVIKGNTDRFEKQFLSMRDGGRIECTCFDNRTEEEQALVNSLKKLENKELFNTAIILRTNLEALIYEELLMKEQIPVNGKKQSTNLWNSVVLNDFISFLSFIYLGHKRADLFGFMNKPNRFLLREAFPFEKVSRDHPMNYYQKNHDMQNVLERFFSMLSLAEKLCPQLAISLFREKLGYDAYLKEKAITKENGNIYLRQANELQSFFGNYIPGTDLYTFVRKEEERYEKEKVGNIKGSGVAVITMHAAKGLEFDHVYLPDVNEGIIPGKKCLTKEAFEEERRLLYVAITRARNTLSIYYTKERNRKLSRFLSEINHPLP